MKTGTIPEDEDFLEIKNRSSNIKTLIGSWGDKVDEILQTMEQALGWKR